MNESVATGRRSVKEIFFEALDKNTPEERAAFLDGACGTNPVQRAKVEVLLADHFQADAFMKSPAQPDDRPTVKLDPTPAEAPAQMLRRYKLLERIGEGGFGEVWMAEQREPVKRRVALKIIKLGMDSRQIVARFEAERQALAMMDHANIAKILDAGVTDTGRPYFVMELVRGIKITEYCDQNQLPTKERLDLFIKVCQAIQHAHQKGIIHRDIKPSNILVTLHDGVPVPKVIDFGIAKATQGELTDKTVFTQFQQFIGTPAYISPEQAEMSGLDIDTRADIYSLGVLLYELLVGQTPFDPKEMMKGGLDALRRIIREQEAPRPSTKLKTLLGADLTSTAQRRHTDPAHLSHQLRGDLDWIVMKCLEKDRTRRYDTANGLAMDIQRHLANEPVVARPPSTAYKIQKAWQRNKLVFSTGVAVVLALLAGLTLAAMGWRQTRMERDRALQAQAGEEVQRKAAQASAVAAQEQKQLAQEREQAVRRYLYTAQINRAQQSWKDGNIAQARDLLSSLRPKPGEEDPRGFEWRYLWRLCQDQSIFTFRGHGLGVQSLAISPDGKTLASAAVRDGEHEIMLWDIVTRLKVASFATGADARFIAFAPDGLSLAVGGWNGPAQLWDVATRRKLATFDGQDGKVENLAFSPNGQTLVTGTMGGEGTLAVWDVATRELQRSLPVVPTDRPWIAFSPDGKTMASTSGDNTVRLWNVAEWKEIAKLAGHEGLVVCVAFSPDGKTLASSSADGTVKLWEVGSQRELVTLRGHKAWVTSATFSPDGALLATTCVDGTIKLWDVLTKQEVTTLKGHTAWVNRALFFPDGQMLASASDDLTLKLWSTRPQPGADVLGRHGALIYDGAFSHDGKLLATASDDRTVKVWRLASGHEATTLPHLGKVKSLSFSPDDQLLVSASDDGNVTLWDLAAQQPLDTLKGPAGSVGCFSFSPDGKTLALGAEDKIIRFWDVAARREITTLGGHTEGVSGLWFSPNGKVLASLSSRGEMRLWDVFSKQGIVAVPQAVRWPQESGHVRLLFSPDSQTLASFPRGATLWRVTDGQKVAELTGHTGQIESAAFSPDSQALATCGVDHTTRLWDVASGKQRAVLRGHAGWVTSVAFSPDGKTLATAGNDSTVRLWNPRSEQEIALLPGGITGQTRLLFSPDDNVLAGYGQELLVRVWRAASWEEIAAEEAKEKAEIKQP